MTRGHQFIVNNYVLGAKLKSAPVEKIYKQERVDDTHTAITFINLTSNETDFLTKLFASKPN